MERKQRPARHNNAPRSTQIARVVDEKLNHGVEDLMTQLLTDDALASVLGHLTPRDLAASRCVCRTWCRVIDTYHLLRTDLLPFSLGGIFFLMATNAFPPFFSCPSVGSVICNVEHFGTGNLSFGELQDHCNGLLLFSEHVVNPATGYWTRLPPPPPSPLPPGMENFYHQSYIMYDPVISPHYEVLLVPGTPNCENLDRATEEAEWPPSPCAMRLFSSRTKRWEERLFKREGPAIWTVEVMSNFPYYHYNRYGVYWRGALYVQCHQNNFVMRISLADGNYRLIVPPQSSRFVYDDLYLGKSEKGVYYARRALCRLQVWSLDESHDQMRWVLKCDREVKPRRARPNHEEQPWLFQCFGEDNYLKFSPFDRTPIEHHVDHSDPNTIFNEDTTDDFYGDDVEILGFHPFKEIVFLNNGYRGIAYHLNTSKVEYLGSLALDRPVKPILSSFVYTPCWMGEILEKKKG